jgi:hypothetical protein
MLMITITLILAAIISGMTGGIAQKQEKPPQLLFEASAYINPDTEKNSFFDIRIVSVSQGIPTRDLKLITEWKGTGLPNRTVITPSDMYPLGYNPGGSGSFKFGDYTLMAGTRLNANELLKKVWMQPSKTGLIFRMERQSEYNLFMFQAGPSLLTKR